MPKGTILRRGGAWSRPKVERDPSRDGLGEPIEPGAGDGVEPIRFQLVEMFPAAEFDRDEPGLFQDPQVL